MKKPPRLAPKEGLPTSAIPLFCVSGIILLPRMRIPLNIFESRYIDMVEEALGQSRLIGVVQPKSDKETDDDPPLYQTGCAGRIVSFSETDDGRFLINLSGVSRFQIAREIHATGKSFRRAEVNWKLFEQDLNPPDKTDFERARLMSILRSYFAIEGIGVDWAVLQSCSDEELVSSLSITCPLEASEKQALLEAPSFYARAQMLIALLEMACLRQDDGERAKH